MKKHRLLYVLSIGVSAILVVLLFSLIYDADNIKITNDIYYNTQRKDILDKKGRYEIPPNVLDYYIEKRHIMIKWSPCYPIPEIYNKYNYGYSESNAILFWVIDMKANTQIGPMSYADFLHYCEKEVIDAKF